MTGTESAPRPRGSPAADGTAAGAAERTPRRSGPSNSRRSKLYETGSATSLIAFFSSLNIDASTKSILLLITPTLAVLINVIIKIIGIFAWGFTELYLRQLINHQRELVMRSVLEGTGYTEQEKTDARNTIDEINKTKHNVLESIEKKLSEVFD